MRHPLDYQPPPVRPPWWRSWPFALMLAAVLVVLATLFFGFCAGRMFEMPRFSPPGLG